MSLPIITQFNSDSHLDSKDYLYVYSQILTEEPKTDKDVSVDHAPLQTEVENLEQFHIQDEKNNPSIEEGESSVQCPCSLESESENVLDDIRKMLEMLGFKQEGDLVGKFSSTGELYFLKEAIYLTEPKDPVSAFKLKKILKNFKGIS